MNRLKKIAFSNLLLSLLISIGIIKMHFNIISQNIFISISLIGIIILFIIRPRRHNRRKDGLEYDELENMILLRASHATLIFLLWLAFLAYVSLGSLGPDLNKPLGITINHLKIAFFSACGIGTFTRGIAILVQLIYYQGPKYHTEKTDA